MSREMYVGESAPALILAKPFYTSALPELSEYMGFRPALKGTADAVRYADIAHNSESLAQLLCPILEICVNETGADSLCFDRCFANWTTSLLPSDMKTVQSSQLPHEN